MADVSRLRAGDRLTNTERFVADRELMNDPGEWPDGQDWIVILANHSTRHAIISNEESGDTIAVSMSDLAFNFETITDARSE